MITAIVTDGNAQPQIRRYDTDNPRQARDWFVQEWIDGGVVWEYFEFAGPNCTEERPIFSPDYLREHGFKEDPWEIKLNVFMYEWSCFNNRGDRHTVRGHFVLDLGGVTAIVIDMSCQEHIRRYQTDSVTQAHDLLIQEWVEGSLIWKSWELAGPDCTAEVPAFSREYLRLNCFDEQPRDVILNVTIFEWWCCTGRPDSDDHLVYGYFVLDE